MRCLAIVWLLMQLAGCAGSARNNTPAAVYDFGLPATSLAGDAAWPKLALEVKAPSWFDGHNIAYRLAYDDPLKMREYAQSQWLGSPASMLAQRLGQQLGVFSANSNTALPCLIRVDLHEFSQVFDTPQQSRGTLHATASLVDVRRRMIAERVFAIAQPARSVDARGGVMAMVAASEEFGRQLAAWLNGLEKAQVLGACRSAAPGK
jgi:ABC-type uncharacterized transport system auxiliary subunit